MAENTVLEVQELTREFTRRGKPFAAWTMWISGVDQGEFVGDRRPLGQMAKAHC